MIGCGIGFLIVVLNKEIVQCLKEETTCGLTGCFVFKIQIFNRGEIKMLLKDKLNITQEEQEYLTNELLQRFKFMMDNNGLKNVSEQVETMMNHHIDNVNLFTIVYKQTFTSSDIEMLLNKCRNLR